MQTHLDKRERQRTLLEIIRAKPASTQAQLQRRLKQLGIVATQSSISRDLTELGIIKLGGTYRLPHLERGESPLVDVLEADTAGDHLIVLKTAAGQASVVAVRIDQAQLPEVVGTVAGDDTIFVAVKNREAQSRAIKQILNLFKRKRS
ncbi:MAG: arginine repressor [Acidobacteriota bacterium]|nr:arginine repressor [Blastocatellia bacterium]MDW8239791.1 arginine repressor [Acidobacteriota bacterium]